jgi:hypothetical protein
MSDIEQVSVLSLCYYLLLLLLLLCVAAQEVRSVIHLEFISLLERAVVLNRTESVKYCIAVVFDELRKTYVPVRSSS